MTSTRRELLRLGGVGATAALVPALRVPTFFGGSVDRQHALERRYLRHGLNLLCSAHATDSFYTGHDGGAFISAYYLCRDEKLEAGSAGVIKKALDENYGLAPDPFPDEEPVEGGIALVLESMAVGIDRLCRGGHDVIFLSLALRAFHDLPETVTRSRIDGLMQTIRGLEPRRQGATDFEIPESDSSFAEFVLKEFLGSTEGGPGQGYTGHLLTHARAILDLRALGHESFASKCLHAFKLNIETARPPSPGADYRADRPKREFLRPDCRKYWECRASARTMELGHIFKYPYGFFGVRNHSQNQELNEVCTDNSYRLFTS